MAMNRCLITNLCCLLCSKANASLILSALGVTFAFGQTPVVHPTATTPAPVAGQATAEGDAPPRKEETKTKQERFESALDEFEAEIETAERRGKYGDPIVERYAKELEEHYRRNEVYLRDHASKQAIGNEKKIREMMDRRQRIALRLWQLERIGTQLGLPKVAGRTLSVRLSQLMTENRGFTKDRNLMQRIIQLQKRASELFRRKMSHQISGNFYFAHPTKETAPAGDEEQQHRQSTGASRSQTFEDGPLQSISASIGRLARLTWKDACLEWNEDHWEAPFAGLTLESLDRDVAQELASRGLMLPNDDRSAQTRKKQLFETPNLILLFQDMRHVLSRGKGAYGYTSSLRQKRRSYFRVNEIDAALRFGSEQVLLLIREESGPERTLEIRKGPQKELEIRLIGRHVLLIQQAADGSVRWVDIGDEDVITKRADSFAELYAEHADEIEARLFTRLRHTGILTPMTRYDPPLVERLLQKLQSDDGETKKQFDRLVAKIDDRSYSVRERAYRQLSDDLDKYSFLIAQSERAGALSAEAASRLAELRKQYQSKFGELDALIAKTEWAQDSSYLTGLLAHVDPTQHPLVKNQIQRVTEEATGSDQSR
jgi:hypothetical protein